jgi:hypothetical protein
MSEQVKGEGGIVSTGVLSVPQVDFVDDVDSFMAENENNAQSTLKKLEETYSKLKMIESNNLRTKSMLVSRL